MNGVTEAKNNSGSIENIDSKNSHTRSYEDYCVLPEEILETPDTATLELLRDSTIASLS